MSVKMRLVMGTERSLYIKDRTGVASVRCQESEGGEAVYSTWIEEVTMPVVVGNDSQGCSYRGLLNWFISGPETQLEEKLKSFKYNGSKIVRELRSRINDNIEG